jgi:hypothetical protein
MDQVILTLGGTVFVLAILSILLWNGTREP